MSIAMAINPSLHFEMSLPAKPTSQPQYGKLIIKKEPGAAGTRLQATSGCIGNQFFRAWTRKGKGPLPPTSEIAPRHWTVSTLELSLPHVRGVEGGFYQISPFSIKVGSVSRGDFGCHNDAGGFGSLGCLVFPHDHWLQFRMSMKSFRAAGYQSVPLFVRYWLTDAG